MLTGVGRRMILAQVDHMLYQQKCTDLWQYHSGSADKVPSVW
jgi:hypothetical protein